MRRFFLLARALLAGSAVYVSALYLTLHVPWLLTNYLHTHPWRWGQVGKVLLDNVPASVALLITLFLNKELRHPAFTHALITVSGITAALAVINHNQLTVGTFRWQFVAISVWSLTAAVTAQLTDIPTAIALTAIASILYEALWVRVALIHFEEPKGWASVATLALTTRNVKAPIWLALGVLTSWALWPLITKTPLGPLIRVPTALGAIMYAWEVSKCP